MCHRDILFSVNAITNTLAAERLTRVYTAAECASMCGLGTLIGAQTAYRLSKRIAKHIWVSQRAAPHRAADVMPLATLRTRALCVQ